MPKVKICGNTNLEDARLAVELGADYLGFIFAASKRKMTVSSVRTIMQGIPNFDQFVGVFANQSKADVESILKQTEIKILQFHGEETARYCDHFMELGYKVIKTFRIKDKMSLKRIDEYNVTAFLFDTYTKGELGGTGKTFDWSLIKNKPFVIEKLFLAGGLHPDNLKEAIETVKPFAVDVASGVESEPGKKDPDRLKRFIEIAKDLKTSDEQKDTLRS